MTLTDIRNATSVFLPWIIKSKVVARSGNVSLKYLPHIPPTSPSFSLISDTFSCTLRTPPSSLEAFNTSSCAPRQTGSMQGKSGASAILGEGGGGRTSFPLNVVKGVQSIREDSVPFGGKGNEGMSGSEAAASADKSGKKKRKKGWKGWALVVEDEDGNMVDVDDQGDSAREAAKAESLSRGEWADAV